MSDWKAWGNKLKWELISFKFLAFYTTVLCTAGAWWGLERLFLKSVKIAESLYAHQYIDKNGVKDIVTHSQTVFYDLALGHLMLAVATVLTAIIAIKGVSYIMDSKQTQEIIKKTQNGDLKENMSKFLPKHHNRE